MPNIKIEVLLRNPEGKFVETGQTFVPPEWLDWSEVPFRADPFDCDHGTTACMNCTNSWESDHYVRIWSDGVLEYISPDYPRESGD